MQEGTERLTEREKETLRLLARGHDAKSVAIQMGLSVHTVNERLRTARQKLGASNSRAAARHLMELECNDPKNLGDKLLGEVVPDGSVHKSPRSNNHQGYGLALGIGGVAMLVLVAAVLFTGVSGPETSPTRASPVSAPAVQASADEFTTDSLAWLALLDDRRWNDSWQSAGAIFKARLSSDAWATSARAVRDPLGPVVSRTLQSAQPTTSLPGAPAGEYWVAQYQTSFANKSNAIETVVLAREGSAWKVVGYFIR